MQRQPRWPADEPAKIPDRSAKGGWRPIRPGGAQRWHYELQRDYFCPLRQRVATPQEAIDSLRRKPPTEYGL